APGTSFVLDDRIGDRATRASDADERNVHRGTRIGLARGSLMTPLVPEADHRIGQEPLVVSVRVIDVEVEAATFLAGESGSDDQGSALHEVAKLEQIRRKGRISGKSCESALHIGKRMRGLEQSTVPTYDADQVPHEVSHLRP